RRRPAPWIRRRSRAGAASSTATPSASPEPSLRPARAAYRPGSIAERQDAAMSAVDTLKRGDLDAALTELTGEVRGDPANPKKRIFLFQLLCLTGAWDRAKIQLDTVVEMDPESALMAKVYGGAIACEAERRKIFSGETTPTIFGDPLPWMAELCEALRLDAKGEHEAAATLRGRAFDAAPTSSGRIDDKTFAWIADADARLGPMVEAIINGRYFWLPFLRLERITLDDPTDLRDQVW